MEYRPNTGFYNSRLLSWFDRFGIQRTAIDRVIVEGEGKVEGIFVVVSDRAYL